MTTLEPTGTTMNKLILPSPVGPLTLVSDQGQLVGCYFSNSESTSQNLDPPHYDGTSNVVLRTAASELELFFARRLQRFTVPVAPSGTEFQRTVWKALQKIPYGKTLSYGELARQLGKPNAMRAVGAANSKNPISIIIPCHRVIGADGSLTGFGGGLARKQFLLGLEGSQFQQLDFRRNTNPV